MVVTVPRAPSFCIIMHSSSYPLYVALYVPLVVLLGPGPVTTGADCYECGWRCECEWAIEMWPPWWWWWWSSLFTFNELYMGNSQQRMNFNAAGTSTYTDGGMGISGDVDALYLRYSLLLHGRKISIFDVIINFFRMHK